MREPGEILSAIRLPAVAARSGSAYEKLSPRGAMDIAVTLDPAGETIVDLGIGLGAVAPVPLRVAPAEDLLRGQPADPARLAAAARAARDFATPISDIRGSAGYRQEMVETLVRRVTERAIAQARARNSG